MKTKKKHTILILTVFLVLSAFVILFLVSYMNIASQKSGKNDKSNWKWKEISQENRKAPMLENIIAFDRDATAAQDNKERINPYLYFLPDSFGWQVNDNSDLLSKSSFLYCSDEENPKGIIPFGTYFHDYCFEPISMYGRTFETRFLNGDDTIYSAAYVLKGDSVDALYGEIREVANQVIQQFSLSAQQIDDVMRSEENFKSYVSSNLQKAEGVYRESKPFTLKQEYAVLGDLTGEGFPGKLRISVHIPKNDRPYATFVWQKKEYALFFTDRYGYRCFLDPQISSDGTIVTFAGEKYDVLSGKLTTPQNFALDY